MQVTEPIHTTRAGWERLYWRYLDRNELVLAILNGKTMSTIRWDTLQLSPNYAPKWPINGLHEAIQELWLTYLRAPGRESLRKKVKWASFGVYGSLPVLTEDAKRIADEVRVILQAIDPQKG